MQRTDDEVSQTRARQIELYGEPLQVLLGRCADTLHLTQVRMSELLGISAPMLSQLINGHRIKIGNPAAAQRLQWMLEICRQVDAGELPLDQAMAQLQRNADSNEVLTTSTNLRRRPRHVAGDIQEIFRSIASAAEFIDAANQVRASHPVIAEMLMIYGAERADRAAEWTDRRRER